MFQHILVPIDGSEPAVRAVQRGVELAARLGTHGLGLVERLFVGSQTQRVLAHTQIPLLTLH